MNNIISGIYKIRNIVNNKVYVGSAINFKVRQRNHFSGLRLNKRQNLHLQNSFNKYGEENFVFEIIEYVENVYLLLKREDYWIKVFKANDRRYGYNVRKFASNNFGITHSKETRKKQSDIKLGKYCGKNNPWYGKHPSLETRKQQSDSHKGKHLSLETIQKLHEANNGKNNPMYGKRGEQSPCWKKVCSDETRHKKSKNRVGKKCRSGSSKYVGVHYRKNNKKFIALITFMRKQYYLGTFLTEQEAAIVYNLKARELYGIDYDINKIRIITNYP